LTENDDIIIGMGKLAQHSRSRRADSSARLRTRRRKLLAELAKVEKQLAKETIPRARPQALDEWLDELSAGLEHLPPLPEDFSRADLYDDHD